MENVTAMATIVAILAGLFGDSVKAVKVCPNCGRKPKFIERHQMYFCSKCVEYIIPVERKEKEKKEVIKKEAKKKENLNPTDMMVMILGSLFAGVLMITGFFLLWVLFVVLGGWWSFIFVTIGALFIVLGFAVMFLVMWYSEKVKEPVKEEPAVY